MVADAIATPARYPRPSSKPKPVAENRTARTGAKQSHTPKPATAERAGPRPRIPTPRRFDGPPSRRKSERPRGRPRRTEPRPAARRRGRPSVWDFRDRNGVGLEDRIVAIVVELDADLEDAAECVGVGRSTARRHAWEVPGVRPASRARSRGLPRHDARADRCCRSRRRPRSRDLAARSRLLADRQRRSRFRIKSAITSSGTRDGARSRTRARDARKAL